MRKRIFLLLVTAACCVWGQTASKYILEMKPGANVAPLAARYRFLTERSWKGEKHDSYAIVPQAPFTAAEIRSLEREQDVIEVETNETVRAGNDGKATFPQQLDPLTEQLTPRAPVPYFGALVRASYVDQPASRIIRLAQARGSYPAGSGIVAVIDTGVDEKHPALKDVLIPGYDFTRDLAGTASEMRDLDQSTVAILDQSTVAILDCRQMPLRLNQSTVAILDQSTVAILDGTKIPAAFGHGTMVAGLVHLVAPAARILPLKAFRGDGSSQLSDIVRAIYYAVDHGADVITMSFSFDTPSVEFASAIAYAAKRGVLLVASSGNDGKEKKVYPAALPRVVGVASTNALDKRSAFSNWGDSAKASAPGEAVVTTYPGGHYAGVWGTSFSTPLVAGAIAIMRQLDSKLDYSGVMDSMEQGARVGGDIGHRLQLPETLAKCASGSK